MYTSSNIRITTSGFSLKHYMRNGPQFLVVCNIWCNLVKKSERDLSTTVAIDTKTGICTSLESDFYIRFHRLLSTKSMLLNFYSIWTFLPIQNHDKSLKTAKIRIFTPRKVDIYVLLSLRANRPLMNYNSEPHAKFGATQ